MNVIVIHELDHDDKEKSVIGVSDSIENAEKVIEKYYGKDDYTEISFTDIRDSRLEYSKVLEIKWHRSPPTRVTLTLEWFSINEI